MQKLFTWYGHDITESVIICIGMTDRQIIQCLKKSPISLCSQGLLSQGCTSYTEVDKLKKTLNNAKL